MGPVQVVLVLLAVSSSFATYVININDFISEEKLKSLDESVLHPDTGLDIYAFLNKYGYPIETHSVTTEDGYILTLHRIPYGRNETAESVSGIVKPPILLQHGLLSGSIDFLNVGPGKSIGLLLADKGYDVWLGNNRGNTFSRNHTTLDPNVNKTFWDFSFDDCGNYDLPAKIDHILETTGQKQLSYIGHSQGTTQFFALAALRPEYNDKINIMVALAPVAYLANMSQPIFKLMAKYYNIIDIASNVLNINELLPHTVLIPTFTKLLCNDNSPFQEVCAFFIYFLVGFNSPQLDRHLLTVMTSNTPAGSSAKMLKHFGQGVNSGAFRRYDYGPIKNLAKYKQLSPPNYNLSRITAPVALYYAQNDLMSAVVNVEQLAAELPNVVKNHLMEMKLFNHLDFIWAKDVDTLLNNDVITLISKYNTTISPQSSSSVVTTSISSSPITSSPPSTTPSGTVSNILKMPCYVLIFSYLSIKLST